MEREIVLKIFFQKNKIIGHIDYYETFLIIKDSLLDSYSKFRFEIEYEFIKEIAVNTDSIFLTLKDNTKIYLIRDKNIKHKHDETIVFTEI